MGKKGVELPAILKNLAISALKEQRKKEGASFSETSRCMRLISLPRPRIYAESVKE
jgi:hypothetical protein